MERVIADILRGRAEDCPDEPLVNCGGGWLTVAEVNATSDRLARGLAERGLSKGDRVALISANREEYVLLFFACAKLGAVQVPLNTFLKGELLRYQLADSGASMLIADRAGIQVAAPLLGHTDITQVVRLDGTDADDPPTELSRTVSSCRYDELLSASASPPRVTLRPSDPLTIMYTSGTTGPSKGCVLSNGYYAASPVALREAGIIAEDDRIFCCFQLFHQSAHSVLMQALMTSGASVCFEEWFSATNFLSRAKQEQATVVWALASMGIPLLAQRPDPGDADHAFRLAVIAGPMPVSAQEEFERRFNTPVTGELYGQTECLGVTMSPVGGPRKRGTLGRPSPHLEVKLVDDEDVEVPTGAVGEIVLRPREPHATYSGYWNKPDATVAAWSNLWHHTGDSARADSEGFLTFVDRKKDCLRRRGENVSSFELESAIATHPDIKEVAVCGVPSPLGEDDIKACIVWTPAAPPTPDELFTFFKESLPYFAIPRFVELRAALPITAATGRVTKHVLRQEGVTASTWDLEELGFSVARADRR
ncbi:MAG: AMP-binding protein [Acidimicrobiales bacterium]|nr:AMP-binding protein [Acidimicrobiales bacterium]